MEALKICGLMILCAIFFAIGSGTNTLALICSILFIPTALALYFWPTITAVRRKHNNDTAIILLNLFLGWTLIGWVAALVWAYAKPAQTVEVKTDDPSTKKCPFCAELVKFEAVKCKHCGSALAVTAKEA